MPTEAFAPMVKAIGAILSTRRGAHWQFSDDESNAVSSALVRLLRHAPIPQREMGVAFDVLLAGSTIAIVTLPRILFDREMRQRPPQPVMPRQAPNVNGRSQWVPPAPAGDEVAEHNDLTDVLPLREIHA